MAKNKLPFFLDDTMKSRYGVFNRYAKSEAEIKWFEFKTHMVFHFLNAFESVNSKNEKVIKIYAC